MNNHHNATVQKTLANELSQAKENFRKVNGDQKAQTFSDFVEELRQSDIEAKALKVGAKASDFSLKNAFGQTIELSEKLTSGPVIIMWYGWCPYCNVTLVYMQRFLKEFKQAGASLIAITPEKPDKSLSTKEKNELQFEILTDESNSVARKYAGVHDLNEQVKGIYWERGVGDYYENDTNEFPVPATYIVDQDFTVRYAFVESDYRRRAEPMDILRVLSDLKSSSDRK